MEPAREVKNGVVEIEGLEEVFEPDCEPIEHRVNTVLARFEQGAKHRAKQGAGMSLKAACIHYKLAPSTLRTKIKRGEIPAQKVQGANGPEWRVFPTGLEFVNPTKQGAEHRASQGADTPQWGYQATPEFDVTRLLTVIEKQSTKLEAAAGQIGYLKAQIDAYDEQVKLLPDLQAQAAKLALEETRAKELEAELERIRAHWWYRFWSWFGGR